MEKSITIRIDGIPIKTNVHADVIQQFTEQIILEIRAGMWCGAIYGKYYWIIPLAHRIAFNIK